MQKSDFLRAVALNVTNALPQYDASTNSKQIKLFQDGEETGWIDVEFGSDEAMVETHQFGEVGVSVSISGAARLASYIILELTYDVE